MIVRVIVTINQRDSVRCNELLRSLVCVYVTMSQPYCGFGDLDPDNGVNSELSTASGVYSCHDYQSSSECIQTCGMPAKHCTTSWQTDTEGRLPRGWMNHVYRLAAFLFFGHH